LNLFSNNDNFNNNDENINGIIFQNNENNMNIDVDFEINLKKIHKLLEKEKQSLKVLNNTKKQINSNNPNNNLNTINNDDEHNNNHNNYHNRSYKDISTCLEKVHTNINYYLKIRKGKKHKHQARNKADSNDKIIK